VLSLAIEPKKLAKRFAARGPTSATSAGTTIGRPNPAAGSTIAGTGRLPWVVTAAMMLVMHDDAKREYAYGPAHGLPDTKVGTFTQALYDEAKNNGWSVISMKNDWKRIFTFD
jgi:hypothetical protein